MRPRLALRVEGLALGLAGAFGYFFLGGDLLLFAVLVVLPDVSIAPYLLNRRAGSLAYNVVHAMVLPLVLLGWAVWAGNWLGTAGAFVWIAHIGADRAFGLGLKYDDAPFRETHLQRV